MIEFAAPIALLALASIPLILYLYRLRPRRQQHSVSSLALWHEALRRRRPSSGLARLLRNFSLVLLLLTALLLALSLADPKWLESRPAPADLILVVDTSASMQASDGSGTRFEQAVLTARELLAAQPEGARTALISSASRPRLVTPFTTSARVLDRALAALRVTDETGAPEPALALAASLQTSHGQIVLLTDGAFAPTTLSARGNVRVVQVGTARGNAGITRFSVRAHPRVPGQFAAFARIHNFDSRTLEVTARLDVAGASVKRVDLAIAPDDSSVVNVAFSGLGGERVMLSLEHADALDVDNRAYAVLPTRAPLLLSVPPNLLQDQVFLSSALDSMPHVGVVSVTRGPRDPGVNPARARPADVVLADGADQVATRGNYLVFGAQAARSVVATGAQVTNTATVAVGNGLLGGGLDLSDVRIHAATLISPRPASEFRYEPLLRVPEGDIAAALLGPDARIVVFGFTPGDTSMPLRAAWPLLLDEALTWLAGQDQPTTTTALGTGARIRLATDTLRGTATVTTPSGIRHTLTITDGEMSLANASEAGFYTFTRGEVYRPVAANLASVSESDIRPRVETSTPRARDDGATSEQSSTLWPWLLLIALITLAWETGLGARLPALVRDQVSRWQRARRTDALAR